MLGGGLVASQPIQICLSTACREQTTSIAICITSKDLSPAGRIDTDAAQKSEASAISISIGQPYPPLFVLCFFCKEEVRRLASQPLPSLSDRSSRAVSGRCRVTTAQQPPPLDRSLELIDCIGHGGDLRQPAHTTHGGGRLKLMLLAAARAEREQAHREFPPPPLGASRRPPRVSWRSRRRPQRRMTVPRSTNTTSTLRRPPSTCTSEGERGRGAALISLGRKHLVFHIGRAPVALRRDPKAPYTRRRDDGQPAACPKAKKLRGD
jgi:hypothetical protein